MSEMVTSSDFEEKVLKSDVPVLVDFFATWCGPCRMVSPIVDEIAEERDDIKVGKINVDEQGELAQMFGIESIPTLAVVQDRHTLTGSVGLRSKEEIKAMLDGCK